jgi:dolichol-phosphate mannosyltransferase
MPKLSIISPIYNEEENIPLLVERLFAVLGAMGGEFEVIMVNDGSTDRSFAILRAEAEKRPELKVIDLKRNMGQTAALMAGIDHSRGDILIAIDADLQNDPEDIPKLLEKLDEGFDVVSGWRQDRKDAALRRNFVSRVANRLISWVSGVHLHDYGCTLKAYRRDVLEGVRLYGEMHRFIPIYATWSGAKVAELPVSHHPRMRGVSKYGLERIFKVILDIMVVKFLDRHFTKPIYVFGGFGLITMAISGLSAVYMLYLKFFEGVSMILTPLPMLVVMTFVTGVLSVLMGLLAEMLVRTYFESQKKSIYLVRQTLNFD